MKITMEDTIDALTEAGWQIGSRVHRHDSRPGSWCLPIKRPEQRAYTWHANYDPHGPNVTLWGRGINSAQDLTVRITQ